MLSKNDRVLFASQYAGIIGGLEVYIMRASRLLRSAGVRTACLYVEKAKKSEEFLAEFDDVYAVSEMDKLKASDFSIRTVHKIASPRILCEIAEKFSPTAFVHDHDYFCPKGYKYFPVGRKNCTRAYSRLFCGLCSSVVPPRHYKAAGVVATIKKNFCTSSELLEGLKKCPKFVVLSHFMKREIASNGIDELRIKVIRPFIEPTSLFASETSKGARPYAIVAAQQVMSKGTPLLLDAVKKSKADFEVHILGTGPRLEDFKAAARDMKLGDRVVFEGFVKNPDEYFKRADFAIFPSLWQEPFGLSGIEAMAHALPVVGFKVGGVGEWLKNGVNGILVPERDTSALAAALDELAVSGESRSHMGNAAKEFVDQNYTTERFLEAFANLK